MYFGNTWHKFYFVITPEEFETIFGREDCEFVTNNTRVNIDYFGTEKQEIFAAYQQYYEKILLREEKYDHKTLASVEDAMRQGMIDQIEKLIFPEVVLGGKVSEEYKLVRSKEPFMEIDPFHLLYKKEKNLLSTIYHQPENVFGLRLTYPKTISLKDKNDNLKGNYATEKYPMCTIFKDIVKHIKKVSHKAKVMKDGLLLTPDFWISDKAKEAVRQNYYLQKTGLFLV
ncbi:hypothetical protein [Capnocytophaga sp. oral taxon 878]|uniref:hypothetical protein n=1 Tax=Capnocytophaga sp. oral taxon 878 TaxID=1316596 RepID=UPI000D034DCD|nr:hypothetical protein [Capnocytophaga sp. oral taxon 878]AVM50016.1 hypothetical protein C4H12_05775 [Capnocytophaga sp. oral taxon 878]